MEPYYEFRKVLGECLKMMYDYVGRSWIWLFGYLLGWFDGAI